MHDLKLEGQINDINHIINDLIRIPSLGLEASLQYFIRESRRARFDTC